MNSFEYSENCKFELVESCANIESPVNACANREVAA